MNIKLDKIYENDLELIMKWRTSAEVTKYMYTDPELNMEKQKEWYKKINKDTKSIHWMLKVNDDKVGVVNIADIDRLNKKCTWGFYLGEMKYKGMGIFKTLEMNMYDYVFEKLDMNKFYAEVFTFNQGVINMHLKCGSKIEGKFKDHIYKDNKFYDVTYMAITKDMWNEIKKNKEYGKIEINEWR